MGKLDIEVLRFHFVKNFFTATPKPHHPDLPPLADTLAALVAASSLALRRHGFRFNGARGA